MFPTSFPEANQVFDKPENMSREQCGAIDTFLGMSKGMPVIITCWKPTKEELEEINRTGRIWVFHYGLPLQPHSVSGEHPFKEPHT